MPEKWEFVVRAKELMKDYGVIWPATYDQLEQDLADLFDLSSEGEYDRGYDNGYDNGFSSGEYAGYANGYNAGSEE